ncbi:MAG: hypothetical protein IKL10_10090 [Clostridia bacterium]|nr:hypothetical protein [Clostridia bacterium]
MKNSVNNFILKAYEYLESVTPYEFDCGKICDKKCCKGSNSDGMLLLPGEEKLFEHKENFSVYFDDKYNSLAVRCNGNCNRNERPFSCRIFPYFIYFTRDNEKCTVAPDIRAIDFCPILEDKSTVNRKFLRALRITGKLFSADDTIKDYLINISELITDFNSL